ncbi:MAG: SAP domain-containing protein [Terriglobia bacterium]
MPIIYPDWSLAHCQLLSRFAQPRPRLAYPDSTNDWAYRRWKVPLGESEREAIERFLKAGLLVYCTVPEQLDWGFTLAQLKGFLRDRGLKLSGSKFEVVDRLYRADPAAMEKAGAAAIQRAGAECILLKCSETGLRLVAEYMAIEREVGQKALDALRNGDFESAISTVVAFEDRLGFPASPLMSAEDARKAACECIPLAFAAKPKILSAVSEDVMRCLCFTAAASYLSVLCRGDREGKCFAPDAEMIKGLKTGLDMENRAALGMIVSHVNYQHNKAIWKRIGVVSRVRLCAVHRPELGLNPCQACRDLDGREWPIEEVPDLPYQYCTAKLGCRCMAIPISGLA